MKFNNTNKQIEAKSFVRLKDSGNIYKTVHVLSLSKNEKALILDNTPIKGDRQKGSEKLVNSFDDKEKQTINSFISENNYNEHFVIRESFAQHVIKKRSLLFWLLPLLFLLIVGGIFIYKQLNSDKSQGFEIDEINENSAKEVQGLKVDNNNADNFNTKSSKGALKGDVKDIDSFEREAEVEEKNNNSPKYSSVSSNSLLKDTFKDIESFKRHVATKNEIPAVSVKYLKNNTFLNSNNVDFFKSYLKEIKKLGLKGKMELHGYACDLGTENFNKQIAQGRINQVAKILDKNDITYSFKNHGESLFQASNNIEAARINNRAVKINYILE